MHCINEYLMQSAATCIFCCWTEIVLRIIINNNFFLTRMTHVWYLLRILPRHDYHELSINEGRAKIIDCKYVDVVMNLDLIVSKFL